MSIFKRCLRNEKGFTMIEMMVVLIIIAVLIAGGIKFYLGNIEKSKLSRARMELYNMAAILDAYYAETGQYPANESEAIEKAGLPEDEDSNSGERKLIKNPWGKNYEYTGGTGTYKIEANDGDIVKVYAEGNNGKSIVEYGPPPED
ncbi:type IV pilin protein [Desulfofundulus thermocisternus]|uniref:type IV pilin protein n=1 Tax=Desulfofundulus thermocisternus TaxID=42471 RepID=UPI00068F11CF|nr:prepilin-type N-terminal cleavage/methylation domain-containing protein [Desulfofundulus thermocisternus]